jgi:hypothetical protein
MSKIQKVKGTPRTRQEIPQPKILGGAAGMSEARTPKVIDQNTKQAPIEIHEKTHGDVVTVETHTRRKPKRKSDPDVRLQIMSKEERAEWEKVKSNVWED